MNFFANITRSLNRSVGIDLGSGNIRIWVEGKGLLLDEPSLIAVDQTNKKVVAVGEQAAKMRGRVGDSIQVFAPVRAPKFIDEELLKAILKSFLARVGDQVYFFSPSILVSLSSSFYPSMKEVLVKVLVELGAGEVMIIDQTLAATIGTGVPVAEASGAFVLQMGAGVIEAASLSLGKVVGVVQEFKAGLSLSEELVFWFATEQNLKISQAIAERVLMEAGSLATNVKRSATVTGLDVKTGEPTKKIVFSEELLSLCGECGQACVKLEKSLLASVSPDLTVDILDKGLLLSGGLAQLHGLEEYLIERLRMPVCVVDEPSLAVIKGVGIVLGHLDEFKQSFRV